MLGGRFTSVARMSCNSSCSFWGNGFRYTWHPIVDIDCRAVVVLLFMTISPDRWMFCEMHSASCRPYYVEGDCKSDCTALPVLLGNVLNGNFCGGMFDQAGRDLFVAVFCRQSCKRRKTSDLSVSNFSIRSSASCCMRSSRNCNRLRLATRKKVLHFIKGKRHTPMRRTSYQVQRNQTCSREWDCTVERHLLHRPLWGSSEKI